MERLFLRKICLAAALLMALAWPAHEIFSHGSGLADNDCRVCAVASSPELNSDCGSALIERPSGLTILVPAAPSLAAGLLTVRPFRGRAPPAA